MRCIICQAVFCASAYLACQLAAGYALEVSSRGIDSHYPFPQPQLGRFHHCAFLHGKEPPAPAAPETHLLMRRQSKIPRPAINTTDIALPAHPAKPRLSRIIIRKKLQQLQHAQPLAPLRAPKHAFYFPDNRHSHKPSLPKGMTTTAKPPQTPTKSTIPHNTVTFVYNPLLNRCQLCRQ